MKLAPNDVLKKGSIKKPIKLIPNDLNFYEIVLHLPTLKQGLRLLYLYKKLEK